MIHQPNKDRTTTPPKGTKEIIEYKTSYKIVVGDKEIFENRINELSEQGFIWSGNMNTNIHDGQAIYSQLMTKTELSK